MGFYTASLKRVREIARRMEERMGWTKEKPTQEGWYWWKYTGEPSVVHVVHSMYGLVIEGHVGLVQNMNAQWQGPIRPEP